ncbi:hypothetical protein OK016_00090 [Vibrio chagasii]|nr:hypothetical protein [Vibrio chagasii]
MVQRSLSLMARLQEPRRFQQVRMYGRRRREAWLPRLSPMVTGGNSGELAAPNSSNDDHQ